MVSSGKHPNSLKNLEKGKAYYFGIADTKQTLCKAKARSTGKRCRQVAVTGAGYCQKHINQAFGRAGLPDDVRARLNRDETRRAAYQSFHNIIKQAPEALKQTDAWKRLAKHEHMLIPLKAELVEAWKARENGHPQAWLDLNEKIKQVN